MSLQPFRGCLVGRVLPLPAPLRKEDVLDVTPEVLRSPRESRTPVDWLQDTVQLGPRSALRVVGASPKDLALRYSVLVPFSEPYPFSAMLHLAKTAALKSLPTHWYPFLRLRRCLLFWHGQYHSVR